MVKKASWVVLYFLWVLFVWYMSLNTTFRNGIYGVWENRVAAPRWNRCREHWWTSGWNGGTLLAWSGWAADYPGLVLPWCLFKHWVVSSSVASWRHDTTSCSEFLPIIFILFLVVSFSFHIIFPSIFLNMFIISSSFLIFLAAVSHPPVPLPGADRGLRSLQRSVEATDPSGVLWLGSDRKRMGEAGYPGSPNWMPSDVDVIDVMFILCHKYGNIYRSNDMWIDDVWRSGFSKSGVP